MIGAQHFSDEQQQHPTTDDAYLEEMTDRVLRLRMLHVEMEETADPWQWMKALVEKG